jgi:glycosyltransferase involved in cell wall biosynthesis
MAIKILFVTASPGHVFGGGKQAFYNLISRLDSRLYSPVVATAPTGRYAEMLRAKGVRLIPLPMSNRFDMRIPYRLARAVREHTVTILHSHGGGRADFFVYLASKLVNIPVKITTVANLVEGWFDVNPLQLYLYKKIHRKAEKVFNHFICVSEYLADNLIHQHELKKNKISTIYNGIDLDYFNAALEFPRKRNEFLQEGEGILIGAIGRLVAEKGLDYLLECMPEVLKRFTQVKLLLVGDGPSRIRLERRVLSLGLKDNIIFTGFRNDIREILSCIDILILPSLLEGFPMIILEAMAMAKPIVASDIPGIREQIINGKNGILVPIKDSNALAAGIISILSNKKVAENIGLAARKTVDEKFSIERMVAETESLYSSLLKANQTPP